MSTSTTNRAEQEPLAFDTLRNAVELLRNTAPTPIAIWLVDCPWYKDRIVRHFPLREGEMGSASFSISGLRIIDFDSANYDPKIHHPWRAVPGRYVEMSDGSMLLLEDETPTG